MSGGAPGPTDKPEQPPEGPSPVSAAVPEAERLESSARQRSLDRTLVRGIAWTGSSKWLIQLISWATSLLVARLLMPTDLGIVGLAAVYLGLASLVANFGLGAAVIQRRDLSERRIAEVAGVSVAFGVVLFGLSAGLSIPLAAFFHEPRARDVIIALGALFVVGGLTVVPRALLARDFRFRELALLDSLEAIVQAVAVIVLAVLGAGYWALVFNQIIGKLLGLVIILRLRPHPVRWPERLRDLRSELAFGQRFVVSQIAWYAYSNADFMVVGRLLGTQAMGIYSLGWQLATVPVERVSALLSSVAPPLFAAVQRDQAALRRYFGAMTRGLALVTLPMSMGLFLVADQLVLVVLGVQWEPAIRPLQILACYSGFRSIATLYPLVLMYAGQERYAARFNVLLALVMPLLFVAGSEHGVTGVAVAWLVGYPAIAVAAFLRRTLHVAGMGWADYGRLVLKPALGTLAMGLTVAAVRWLTAETVPMGVALVLEIVVGVGIYAGFLRVFCREDIGALIRVLRDRKS